MNKILYLTVAIIVSFSIIKADEIKVKRKIINNTEYVRSTNPSDPPILDLQLKEVTLIEEINLDPPSMSENYNKIIKIDENAQIHILNRQNCKVLKYSKSGELIAETGGRGQGPGEFESPNEIYLDKDSVKVISHNYNTIQLFDRDLNFIQSRTRNLTNQLFKQMNGGKFLYYSSLDYNTIGDKKVLISTYMKKENELCNNILLLPL